ncbi:MAG: ComF family protein [Armatimonadetes bacterium]|nr:ComF family protein [Armatimonadota bacterium]
MSASAAILGLLDLLFPPKCSLCGLIGADPLCPACAGSFSLIQAPYCDRCGYPRVGDLACTRCADHESPLILTRAYGVYEGALRDAVHALKYRSRARLGPPLGRLMAACALTDPGLASESWHAVVPVPIHPARCRQRGFNQSDLLAQPVALALGTPLESGWLARCRRTAPQARLPWERRLTNLRGAFRAPDPGSVRGQRVLLIDDVLTTRSTVSEAARTLLMAGAGAVGALALAMDV